VRCNTDVTQEEHRFAKLLKTGLCSRNISQDKFVPELSKKGCKLKAAPNLPFSFQIVEQ
jgi:hypothetical protein